MRAVGYVRVSTDEQASHGVSLEVQREQIRAYAKLYGLEIVGVFVDEGASAGNLDREGLAEALRALESGYAEALIVMKLDRLTRNLRDLLDLVSSHFGKHSLFSVAEHLDPRSPAGRFTMNILAAVAQWELETIRERTKSALAHKRAKGEYTGGGVPFGWRLGQSGELIADAPEQSAVEYARSLRAGGLSFRKVGDLLAKNGFLPRGNTSWRAEQVKRLCRIN